MIPGYTHITTKTFKVDDDMLIVSTFFKPDEAESLRTIWEVTSYEDYKEADSLELQLYCGTNWFRAFDVVSRWHERRYKKKLNGVLEALNDMDRFSIDMIKEARK